MFDNLYVQADKPGGLPVKLKLGRQDIVLGNGWLMLDGTPLDGSRTIYLDALRATWSSGATSVEAILIKAEPQNTASPWTAKRGPDRAEREGPGPLPAQQVQPDTDLDAYYFRKNNAPAVGTRRHPAPTTASPSPSWRIPPTIGHVNAVGGASKPSTRPPGSCAPRPPPNGAGATAPTCAASASTAAPPAAWAAPGTTGCTWATNTCPATIPAHAAQ
jgi:hypothetical protein